MKRSQCAFACGARTGVFNTCRDIWREDAIAIMDDEAIGALQRQTVPELLDRPFRRGMVGEIPVHDPACADVEEDEHIESLKVAVTTMKKSQARTAPA